MGDTTSQATRRKVTGRRILVEANGRERVDQRLEMKRSVGVDNISGDELANITGSSAAAKFRFSF